MTASVSDPYSLRLARPDELRRLMHIEDVAGRLYAEVGMDPDLPGIPLSLLQAGCEDGLLWVAQTRAGEAVGFALCWVRPGAVHLRELDVLPDHGRRGLGARLIAEAEAEARRRGLPAVTLTTFAEVPWNAPYYARKGFVPLREGQLPEWLSEIRAHERAEQLDRWPRLAMQKPVARAR